MSEVGIGIIGCGLMGMINVRLLLAQDPRLKLRAVCDPDPRSVQSATTEISPAPRVYEDFRALVTAPNIDWVMIASWNRFHREHAVAALEAGKHVFCQKPLATNLEDCKAMYDAWKRSDRMFNIGFNMRYSPHYRKIKDLLRSGAIGQIISMEFNETLDFNHGGYIMGDWRRHRADAGTHLLEKCCHDIDLVNWMLESRARRVASFGGLNFFTPENAHHIERLGKNSEGKEAYRTWGGLIAENPFRSDKDIFDNQVAIIEYENGVRATFHTNCNAGIPERRMYILGTEGALRADVLTGMIETKRIGFDTTIENIPSGGQGGHGGGDEVLAKELAASMLHGTPPSVGIEDGVRSAVTCFAIDEAADTAKVVDVQSYWERVGIA